MYLDSQSVRCEEFLWRFFLQNKRSPNAWEDKIAIFFKGGPFDVHKVCDCKKGASQH